MSSIRMITKPCADIPVGASKFLGCPDVWLGFEWPYCQHPDGDYDLTFVAQINCADVAPFDRANLLPHSGILYFFYDLDGMPPCGDSSDACRVLYYNGSTDNLATSRLVNEDGSDAFMPAQAVQFCLVEDGFLSDHDETHLLLGAPSFGEGGVFGTDTHVMLLQVDSFGGDYGSCTFQDEGFLLFWLPKKDLQKLNFNNVAVEILST